MAYFQILLLKKKINGKIKSSAKKKNCEINIYNEPLK